MNEKIIYTCADCGREFTREELVEVANGNLICPDCLNDYAQCDDCGEWVRKDDLTCVANGDYVCQDCLDSGYSYCDHCDQWVSSDDIVSINDGDEYWCQSCADEDAYMCDDCGDWYTGQRIWHDDGYRHICRNCADDWVTCVDCGRVIRLDDAHESCGDWYCDSCYGDRHSSAIHDYGYKPDPVFGRRSGEAPDALTFGVELEVDGGDDPVETASDVEDIAEGRVYCKHDGSLNEGFEIVSHPGTLAHHMYDMRWKGICAKCENADFRSHDTETCGLHIHVGKKQLGAEWDDREAVAARLVVLAARLWSDLVVFSRRKESRLEEWAACPNVDITCPDDLQERALGTWRYGRYQAVNLTNSSTIEFRLFRGTLKRDTIIASLQLVNNLCKYAMSHDMETCRNAVFTDIVDVHAYRELVAYCVERHLVRGVEPQAETVRATQPAPCMC